MIMALMGEAASLGICFGGRANRLVDCLDMGNRLHRGIKVNF